MDAALALLLRSPRSHDAARLYYWTWERNIIVAGDSFAMGWGVEQEETFPQQIERATGKRTLNGGTSSYGTVRELRQLEPIDASRVETLVIQYCDNDQIVVLETNNLEVDAEFTSALAELVATDPALPDWLRRIRVVDLSQSLSPDMFWPLDGHLNPEGHAEVARRVLDVIGG